jgi:hypothetical protein
LPLLLAGQAIAMPELCFTYLCNIPADDEYHFYEYVPALGREIEVAWMLCGKCCEFAESVVELISELDNERERETWQR